MTAFICEKIIKLCVAAVCISIVIDFIIFSSKSSVKKYKRSFVATGSMFGFFAVYALILGQGLGAPSFNDPAFNIVGTVMVAVGCVVNITGRIQLKDNWANHIKIYEGHRLVRHGVYKYIRHPLYASIMLMFFGGSLAYMNWLCAVITGLVFIPFMKYRAKQEEAILLVEFEEYETYRENTGMFFPKLWG